MHVAASEGCAEAIAALLDAGTNPKTRDKTGIFFGRTARDVALEQGHTAAAVLLKRAEARRK